MLDLITVVVMMIVSAVNGEETDRATTVYERRRDFDGLVFSSNLILETSASSRAECGARCRKSRRCAAFTFSPLSDTCREHSYLSTSQSPSSHSPGAETWRLPHPPDQRILGLGKPTRQSSTEWNGLSDKAVDGNPDPRYGRGSCTHTDYGDFTPYWLVDLEETVEVHAVIITNRGDCCGARLKDFDVEIFTQDPVGNSAAEATLCYHYTGSMPQGATQTLNCSMPYFGRFVRIRQYSQLLTLCEVQVLGI